MFKFDFAIDDVDVDPELSSQLSSIQIGGEEAKNDSPEDEEHDAGFTELTVDQLLGHLPHVISYSPLVVPILSDQKDLQQVTLARRDLFDARFQLIAQEEAPTSSNSALQAEGVVQPGPSALAFVEAPSDLVPGVYEGGLKTWECALDLAGHLAAERLSARGKRVLEIGCGTAVPSMYLLHELLAALPPSEDGETVETELHMQDYNASVLSLVTFPNLLLTWYMSAAAAEFRNSQPCPSVEDADAAIPIPPADPHTPGDLPLPPALTAAFRASLAAHRITLRFFAGAWGAFAVPHPYALVLTSETIYRSASLAPLLRLLREAAGSGDQADQEHMCLVAAKVLYFGVGGGVEEFVRRVREMGGEVEPMWEVSAGVGRRVMRVRWHAAD